MKNNKIGIIIGREYANRVRKKSFLLMTLILPIVFIGIICATLFFSQNSVAKEKIAVFDYNNEYLPILSNTENYTFVPATKSEETYREEGANNKEGLTAVLVIKEDLIKNPQGLNLLSFGVTPPALESYICNKLSHYVSTKNLQLLSNNPEIPQLVQRSKIRVSMPTYKINNEGKEERTISEIYSLLGMIMCFVSFFFISTYGASVMGVVLEEKKNRIMEVMVSSVKPFDMMMGKIIAMGLVGITQIAIWILTGVLVFLIGSTALTGSMQTLSSLASLNASQITGLAAGISPSELLEIQTGITSLLNINFLHIGSMFLFYFIGGFLLYASLYAAFGSAVSSEEDSSQFVLPVMLLLMVSFYAGFGCAQNPDGPMAFWCSLIPFTSPIVMLVRLPYGSVPVWEQILSVVLLFATFISLTWISAKIYRVGILMYGKKPSIKEMMRWIKFK